jgi:hypothetical protein
MLHHILNHIQNMLTSFETLGISILLLSYFGASFAYERVQGRPWGNDYDDEEHIDDDADDDDDNDE